MSHPVEAVILQEKAFQSSRIVGAFTFGPSPNRERPLRKPVMLSERLRRFFASEAPPQFSKSPGFHLAIIGWKAQKMDQSCGPISRSLPLDGDRGHAQWFEAATEAVSVSDDW